MGYKIGCDIGKSAFKLACDGEKMGSDGKYEVLTCELPSYRSSGKLKTLVSGTGFESLQVRYDGEGFSWTEPNLSSSGNRSLGQWAATRQLSITWSCSLVRSGR